MKTAMTKTGAAVALLVLGVVSTTNASAQTTDSPKTGQTSGTDQSGSVEGMDHSQMDHSRMQHAPTGKQKAKGSDEPTSMEGMDHSQMDHSRMQQPPTDKRTTEGSSQPTPMEGMDHSQMNHSGMDHSQMNHAGGEQMQGNKPVPQQGKSTMGDSMGGMGHDMKMGPMQGGSPPPDARDPDAYAEGTTFANLPGNEMTHDMRFGRVLLDKFEYAKGDGEHGQNLDAEAWYGNDYNKAWFKAEGERRGGHLDSLRTEALWDRTFAAFWSTQLGVRHDTGGGDSRNWLAFGVRGLAPYWFDTTATAYWSGGRLAARFNVRYELLFTQRLILEPEIEGNLYSKSDPARGIGSGLSDLELGLRLRYEIRRQFAPYIGVTWARNFGDTADYARARGERNKSTQIVAGVRLWF